MDS
ncbi:hypothetical protein VCHENC02_0491A, partial [Vibrio harveyi]|jgi:hypothetical protein